MKEMYKDESQPSINYHFIYNYPSDILKSQSVSAILCNYMVKYRYSFDGVGKSEA